MNARELSFLIMRSKRGSFLGNWFLICESLLYNKRNKRVALVGLVLLRCKRIQLHRYLMAFFCELVMNLLIKQLLMVHGSWPRGTSPAPVSGRASGLGQELRARPWAPGSGRPLLAMIHEP